MSRSFFKEPALTKRLGRIFFLPVQLRGLVFLFLNFIPCTLLAQESIAPLVKKIKPAVVTVTAYDSTGRVTGMGSGFFVRQNHLITNHHVLTGAYRAEIKTADGNLYTVLGVMAENRESDLILLKAEVLDSIIPLDVIATLPEVGERVVVVGSPFGFEQTVSDGIVSSLRVAPGFDTVIQITAPFSPGSSGSPVVNLKGEVIGVAARQIMQGQNLNFAVPGKWVLALKPGKIQTLAEWSAGSKKEDFLFEQKTSPAIELFSKGMELLLRKEYLNALSYFEKTVAQDPNFAEAWVNISSCNGYLERWEETIQACRRAINIQSDLMVAYENLAGACGNLGRWTEAVDVYKQAIRIKPDYPNLYAGLCRAYSNLGLYDDALRSGRQALRIKPDFAEAYCHLGRAYGDLGRHQKAIEACLEAIRLKPDYAEAYFNLGVVYGDQGRYLEEVEAYKEAIRIESDYAEAHCNLGLAYFNLHRHQEAIISYKNAIRFRPDFAEAHHNLGVAFFTTGNKASALDEYKILKNLNKELANRLFDFIYK